MSDLDDLVSVAIPNWNGAAFIAQCLDSVFDQSHPPSEVIVVDNGSTDGSVEIIRDSYPQIKLIERPRNEGFARGCNLAIQRASSPFILILNTDVFLDRDFLFEALQSLRSAPDIGLIAAKIFQARSKQIDNVGLYLKPWLKVVNSTNHSEPEFVFAGSGSSLLCRREMLEDIQESGEYFDESFFAYWEDIDLAWRAQLRGWRCVFSPSAIAEHIGSGSQNGQVRVLEKPAFLQRHIWKNRYMILTKNASIGVLIWLMPWIFLFELFYWPFLLFRLPHRLPVFALAHIDFLRSLGNTIKRRQIIQQERRVGNREILKFFRRG